MTGSTMNKLLATAAAFVAIGSTPVLAQSTELLNASYDISRELFDAENAAFEQAYAAETGVEVIINQSHAGSSAQVRAILEGLPADVVTFNQVLDVLKLVEAGYVATDWAEQFPNNASPFYSLPAFLVRAGNPKGIEDWGDLAQEGVQVIFPNPRTSGNGRYTYLAARAWAEEAYDGDEAQVEEFLIKLFNNVPVFETGGRAATTAFTERKLGDVLVSFEAEVLGVVQQYGTDQYESVVPSISLLSEFPVAVVEKVAGARGTTELATDYLGFLYTTEAQEIAAQRFYRPIDEAVAAEYADNFPAVQLVTVDEAFGGWETVEAEHFASGGLLDQVYVNE